MTDTKDVESQRDKARQRFIRALVALLRPLVLEDIGGNQCSTDGNQTAWTTGDIT